jgi:hypothetical protein
LENSDLLLATAEVAAAFAGFTAVVSVLDREPSLDPAHRWRVRGMIENSLLVVCFSLFPFIPGGFFDAETTWRWSSILLGLSWVVAFTFAMRRATRLGGRTVVRTSPVLLGGALVIAGLGLAALFLNAIGRSFGSASTLYFTGLFAPLLLSAALFVRIVVLTEGGR